MSYWFELYWKSMQKSKVALLLILKVKLWGFWIFNRIKPSRFLLQFRICWAPKINFQMKNYDKHSMLHWLLFNRLGVREVRGSYPAWPVDFLDIYFSRTKFAKFEKWFGKKDFFTSRGWFGLWKATGSGPQVEKA